MSRTAQQIAADRARYEEHQRKGLEFAPRALPGPSPLPAPRIDGARLIHTETIPGGWYWTTGLKRGEIIRLAQDHGPASIALVAWNAADPSERLNLPDTVKVQWTTAMGKGRVLFSDMGRVLLSVIEDSSGAHDGLVGGSTAASNAARYPDEPRRNTRDNLVLIAGKLGLGRRDIPSALSFFAPVRVKDDGSFVWRSDLLNGGDYVELRAEMNVLTILNTCQHPLDPNPRYEPKPVRLAIRKASVPGPDDPCRVSRPENQRGFTLTERYFL